MNIWLLQASEPMPVVNKNERLLRMGMIGEELNKRKWNITWFSSTFDHFNKKQIYDEDKIIKVNKNYKLILYHTMSYYKNISIARIINHKILAMKFRRKSKDIKKPDIIYVSFPTIDFAEEAVKYGKKNNVPVIVDVRDLWPDIFYHNLHGIKKIIALPYIQLMQYKTKKIMKDAYAINSISQPMLDLELDKADRVQSENDRFFYIGYDKPKLKKNNNKKLNNKYFNVSFFGTINNQFNYDIIVDVAKKLQCEGVIINICGDGPQFNELKGKVDGVENIKLYGWLNREKLNSVLSNSQIGLAPYKNTFDFNMSVSNKFAEYISYGLPIVITSEGYMKSILEEHKCGISSMNPDEIVDFIKRLKNNEKEYRLYSNNAIELYKRHFVADNIYSNLVDYLENVVNNFKS